ncbi:MAG: hypothetical protein JJT76_17545 [Clostridiaceae bacterium]|nr:hypothetical protein [Clostridiaceae bacterium]
MGKKDIKTITLGDIPEQYHYIVQEIGIESFIKLCKVVGGGPIYVPKLETTKRELRNMQIIDSYFKEGLSFKEMQKKYGLTESHLRRIVEKGFDRTK